MKISRTMNLDHLAERMGDAATRRDAVVMRECLVAWFDGRDTADVSDYHWQHMLTLTAVETA